LKGIEMSFLDNLGLGGLMGQQVQSNQSGFQRAQQYNNSQYGSQIAGLGLTYNQAMMMQNRPQWVFNGVTCNSPRDMANIIWPTDCAEKTHFLLKYE